MSAPGKAPFTFGRFAPSARLLGAMVLLCAVTFLAYGPALRGGFVWDDAGHVTKPELRSWQGLERIWGEVGATQQYYPLLHSFFWVEHRLWGDATLGYHVVSVLLHVGAAWLAWLILRRLAVPGAGWAGAIFALHPAQVESVAWIAEQKNLLSGVFYLGALAVYLRFDERRRSRDYVLALALFVCGLLSKTVVATLPAALLVIFWWQRGRLSWRRDVAPLLPWFLAGAAAGLFTAWVERHVIGAQGEAFTLTLAERGLVAGRVLWFYAGKLAWPANLAFFYPRWEVNTAMGWQWLFPLGALLLTLGLWRRRGRGLLAGWLFYAVALFPALGFFNVFPFLYSYVANHFQYLAGFGLIVPAGAGLARAWEKTPAPRRDLMGALGVALLGALGLLTWQQSGTFRDGETLYRAAIERNPAAWAAHNNLGAALAVEGRRSEAMALYRQVLRHQPDFDGIHANLANAFFKTGQLREAVAEYEMALRMKPVDATAHNNLGFTLGQLGDFPAASGQLREALRLDPALADAHFNLGVVLFQQNQPRAAALEFDRALQLRPAYPDALNNLGTIVLLSGQAQESLPYFAEAVRLQPAFAMAHYNLGRALAQLGRNAEALQELNTALRHNPNLAEARKALEQLPAQTGQ